MEKMEAGVASSTVKKIEVTISTTNDLSFPIFTLGIQVCSNLVQLLQFILLICVIYENRTPSSGHPTFTFRMGQIFVFFYLSFSTVNEISSFQRIKMRMAYQDKDKHHKNLIVRAGSESTNYCVAFVSLMGFTLLVVGKSLMSCVVLTKYYFCELCCPNDQKLITMPVPITQWLARMISVFAELYIMILTIIAAVLLTNAQDNLVDMLFNFAGVMVISQLDEVMLAVLPKYKLTLTVDQDFDEEPPDFTRVNAEQGYVCLTMAVLIIAYVISAIV